MVRSYSCCRCDIGRVRRDRLCTSKCTELLHELRFTGANILATRTIYSACLVAEALCSS